MASDKARRTYDGRQGYRAVVYQQGRVTLEADENEAEEIRDAESRAELIDIIGPTGTPDDGFKIGIPAPLPAGWKNYDFGIAAGTMYLGGVRAVQAAATTYFGQVSGDWVDGPPSPGTPTRELVYLSLVDAEVSAVEDGALKEVALGGPDSAQRRRYLQRVQRLATDNTDCPSALAGAAAQWAAQGLTFDPATNALRSGGKLRADFVPDPGTADPCQPVAQAGFLGDENQLIRVQVIAPGQLLWGFDNASFMYRATARDAHTLVLGSAPIDAFHRPRANQVVEVLRGAVKLPNGEFAAAMDGIAVTLSSAYQTADQSIGFSATALPPDYIADPHLFVRVWEQQLAFTANGTTPVVLGNTGVRVFLSSTPAVGDFWMIGVRPGAPTSLFPARLGTAQAPDGPQRFVTPLAVVEWSSPTAAKISDCRQPFDNLVELTKRKTGAGCCTVSISPEDLDEKHTLQTIVDELSATAGEGRHPVLCLKPGHYRLTKPLRLEARHAGLTIEGCSDGIVLEAASGAEAAFVDGLVVLTHANGITLRGLRFHLPLVPFSTLGNKLAGLRLDVLSSVRGPRFDNLFASIGLRPVHSAQLRVEDCLFRYTVPEVGQFFGVGIFASSECWGFRVHRCRFLHEEGYLRGQRQGGLVGIALFGNVALRPVTGRADLTALGHLDGTMVRAVLEEATITECRFAGLGVAIELAAELGSVRIEDNVIRDCVRGVIIEEVRAASRIATRHGLDPESAQREQVLIQSIDNRLELPSLLGRIYPLPAGLDQTVLREVTRTEEERARSLSEAARAEINAGIDWLRGAAERLGFSLDLKRAEAAPEAGTHPDAKDAAEAKPKESKDAKETKDSKKSAAGAKTAGRTAKAAAPAVAPGETAPTHVPPIRVTVELGVVALVEALVMIERRFLDSQPPDTRLRCTLRLVDNDFATLVADGPSLPSLFVISFDHAAPATLAVTGNQLRSRAALATCLLFTDRATVTGNTIANEAESSPTSLVLLAVAVGKVIPVAVTGNLFVGPPVLPARSTQPAPLDTWLALNTVI